MNCNKQICLKVCSNIQNYEIEIRSNNDTRNFQIQCGAERFLFETPASFIFITARSTQNYNKILYFSFYVEQSSQIFINLNFEPSFILPAIKQNVFYLKDLNYGLNINGNLFFASLD